MGSYFAATEIGWMLSLMSERLHFLRYLRANGLFYYYSSSQLFTRIPRWEALPDDSRKLHHEDRELFEKTARKGGKTLFFARSAQEGETWV